MSNPFTDLPEHQRHWFITYYKLRAVWDYLGYNLDHFPRLRNGPIREPTPWQDPKHPLNRKLKEVQELVEEIYGPHWRRWQDYWVTYFVMDMDGEVRLFEPDYRLIQVKGFKACKDCDCIDKCYQYGLCGLGCTNQLKNCENIQG